MIYELKLGQSNDKGKVNRILKNKYNNLEYSDNYRYRIKLCE